MNKKFDKYILQFLVIAIQCSLISCTTVTVIIEWKDIPKDRPIRVTINSGEQYEFEQWTLKPDSMLIGLTKSTQYRTQSPIGLIKTPPQSVYIPTANISSIATVDDTSVKFMKTSLIVVGCATGVVFLVYLYYVFDKWVFAID